MIKKIHLSTRLVENVKVTKQAIGVTFDGKSYFWTEMMADNEAIVRWTPGTTKKKVLITVGLDSPEDLSVDWLTGNIYFTDSSVKHIAVCTANGFYCTNLISSEALDMPRAIVLHSLESLMFWTDWGKNSHIGVAFMDGKNAKVLVDNVSWPNGLALDWFSGRIYWVDAKILTIESSTIDGKDRRVILENVVKHPFGLAVFEDRLYWSDWETKSIESCNKITGKDCEQIVQGENINGECKPILVSTFFFNLDFYFRYSYLP